MTYGVSIELNDKFDFNIDSYTKGMSLVSDVDNLSQALTILLNVHEGEIRRIPSYGTKISSIVGTSTPMAYVEYIIRKALIKDPRIISVVSLTANRVNSQVSVDIKLLNNENATVDLRGIIIW